MWVAPVRLHGHLEREKCRGREGEGGGGRRHGIANLVQVLGGELELTVMVSSSSGPRCFNLIL